MAIRDASAVFAHGPADRAGLAPLPHSKRGREVTGGSGTGHFALETHGEEIAAAIREFLIPDYTAGRSGKTALCVRVE